MVRVHPSTPGQRVVISRGCVLTWKLREKMEIGSKELYLQGVNEGTMDPIL